MRSRLAAWPVILALLLCATRAAAGPKEWFDTGVRSCQASVAAGNPFQCSVCGVPVTCGGGSCNFGALSAAIDNPQSQRLVLERGFSLYCAGTGGALLNAASAAGVQLQTLSAIFRSGRAGSSPGLNRSGGGMVEVRSSVVADTAGVVLPAGWAWRLGELANLDLSGGLIVGAGGGIKQFGFNANPAYTRLLRGQHEWQKTRVLVSAVLPLQVVGVFGDGIDSTAAWMVGIGGAVGVVRRHNKLSGGLGATVDFRYSGGPFLPLTVVARGSYDVHRFVTIAAQLGVALEPLAGSNIVDTIKPSVLFGLEIGRWIVGYQGFFQPGSISSGLALAFVGAAGGVVQDADAHPTLTPTEPTPTPTPTPAPIPKVTPATRPAPATQPATQPAPTTRPATQAAPATQPDTDDEPGRPR